MPQGDNTKYFCHICAHGVMDMEKHLQSKDHKRQVKREASGGYNPTSPRMRGQPRVGIGEGICPFPGHLNLKRWK